MSLLVGVSEGSQLPQYRILICKTVTKEQLSCCITVRLQTRGCKTNKLLVMWNRRSWAFLRKQGMLVLGSLKGHLTADIKATLLVFARTYVLVKKPFKDHLKKRYSEWLLTANCALNGDGRKKKPSVTCWSVDHNSMAAHLNRSDCEGF